MERRGFRLLLSSLVALVALQVQAEAKGLPRLVVCISIDQLRSDYLEELESMMEPNGLRLMLQRGQYTRAVDFPLYQPNAASAVATLFTGAYPEVHGIESREVYLREKAQTIPIYWDDAYQGNYTRENLSPRSLLVQSLGDRIKEASGGLSLVYSIAVDAEEALAMAGASADGAYWIDSRIGAWSSSNYYPQMLPLLEQYNRSASGPNKRLVAGSMQWKPLSRYSASELSFSDRGRSFAYRYTGSDAESYKRSALVNEEVTDLALKLIETAGYEGRKAPGLLALSYKAIPHSAEELSAEDIDTYIRLDKQIARLLASLDRKFGLANCLISLSGTGYTSYIPRTIRERSRERTERRVSTERLTALTNMFLTASFGQGQWISANKDGRIYLNRKLIENRKLSLQAFRRAVADFLTAADGIARTYTLEDIRQGGASEEAGRILRSVHPRYEADVYWTLLPSWSVEESTSNPLLQPRSGQIPSPFILLAPQLEKHQTTAPREVRDIVRIICDILRIRPPNA